MDMVACLLPDQEKSIIRYTEFKPFSKSSKDERIFEMSRKENLS
ncbi:MAG: hypothetical protein JWQ57_3706, partial [Mucilaginibacter sp.]|nr:hypothetical protein [Mucilaginibacter sp.]